MLGACVPVASANGLTSAKVVGRTSAVATPLSPCGHGPTVARRDGPLGAVRTAVLASRPSTAGLGPITPIGTALEPSMAGRGAVAELRTAPAVPARVVGHVRVRQRPFEVAVVRPLAAATGRMRVGPAEASSDLVRGLKAVARSVGQGRRVPSPCGGIEPPDGVP